MPQSLFRKTLSLSSSPRATWWMAALSFTESSFFLIPPDVLLVPMCLAQRSRAMWIAFVCTISSVLGGVLGYYIGLELFELAARPILEFYEGMAAYSRFREHAHEWGFMAIALKGLTPIPYKVVAIGAGAVELGLGIFVVASVIGRGSRFFLIAFLCARYGDRAQTLIERHMKLFVGGMIAALVGGFYLLKFL